MKLLALLVIAFCGTAKAVYAQYRLPVPANHKKAYSKGMRTADGRPGKNYWQNAGAYDIDINFNPSTRLIKGTETIVYTNNSPDTLGKIVFRLYPNLYKKGAQRLMSIDQADLTDGMKVEKIILNNEILGEERLRVDGTVMTVRNTQVLPGQSVTFTITFNYQLNKGSHIRTGEVTDGAYFIAYFFPRIAVYDDTDGWNTLPYLGTQEFYNDFCNFKLAVTVPVNYMVWATGDLKNCSEVFTEKYCSRIKAAETGDGIVNVIDTNDLKAGNITTPNASNTWRYQADNVTDMAIGISNHYIWQSSSLVVDKKTGRRTRVDAVFNPVHKDYYCWAMPGKQWKE
jgi:hypothetical protein